MGSPTALRRIQIDALDSMVGVENVDGYYIGRWRVVDDDNFDMGFVVADSEPEAWRKISRGDWVKSWGQIDRENTQEAEREAEEEREREAEQDRRREANRASDSPSEAPSGEGSGCAAAPGALGFTALTIGAFVLFVYLFDLGSWGYPGTGCCCGVGVLMFSTFGLWLRVFKR